MLDNWCQGYETREFSTIEQNYGSLIPPGISFFINDGKVEFDRFESNPLGYQLLLDRCSPLVAILGKKANMFANGKLTLMNSKRDTPLRGGNKDWEALFKNPNKQQTESEFLHQLYVFMMLRGFCYAYPVKSVGFDVPDALFLLPPWYVMVEAIPVNLFDVAAGLVDRKVVFTWRGSRTEFKESELILFKDPGAIKVNEFTMLPESRLLALSRPIATLIAAAESRHTIVTRRGAHGILSNSTSKGDVQYVPVTDDEKQDLQRDYGKYGRLSGQAPLIITSASLSYQKIGDNIKDLMLFDEHRQDIMDMCDTLNFPYELMSNPKGQTYENMDAAKLSVYQDVIIPNAKVTMQQLQQGLCLDGTISIEMDYSHIEILQESMKDTGAGTLAMNEAQVIAWNEGLITKNMWLESLGLDKIEQPEFDMYVYEFNKWAIDEGFQPDTINVTTRGTQSNDPANQPPPKTTA